MYRLPAPYGKGDINTSRKNRKASHPAADVCCRRRMQISSLPGRDHAHNPVGAGILTLTNCTESKLEHAPWRAAVALAHTNALYEASLSFFFFFFGAASSPPSSASRFFFFFSFFTASSPPLAPATPPSALAAAVLVPEAAASAASCPKQQPTQAGGKCARARLGDSNQCQPP